MEGALLGLIATLPGLALIRKAVKDDSCRAPDTGDTCGLGGVILGGLGLSLAASGYVWGTSFGAETGWNLGSTRRDPAVALANLTLVSLQF